MAKATFWKCTGDQEVLSICSGQVIFLQYKQPFELTCIPNGQGELACSKICSSTRTSKQWPQLSKHERLRRSYVFQDLCNRKWKLNNINDKIISKFILALCCTLHVLNPSFSIIMYPFQTYTIQGTPKDGGILPRSLDVLFNSIEGKHYTKMNLKPRFCTDVIRLTEDEEQRENSYKNALISSLDKDVSLWVPL